MPASGRHEAVHPGKGRPEEPELDRRQVHLALEERKDGEDRLTVGVVEDADRPEHEDDPPLVAGTVGAHWVESLPRPGVRPGSDQGQTPSSVGYNARDHENHPRWRRGPVARLAAPGRAGFVPLFNGRDLTGWVSVNCAPTTWSVRDGMIYSTGKPICELRTTRMFENFILELEYQHLDPQGNAGVFIWGDALTAPGQPFVRAIEVQVLDGRNTENYTSHGDVFAIHGARMTPDRPHPNGSMRSLPSERRARPAGEWNHYRITAQNGTIKLAVNGKEVSGGYDISPRKGYIHLESEGGRVLYRNLRIKELPSAAALAPEHIAQADEGFVSIYTGVDFSGWRHGPKHQGHWEAKDWVIAYDGGGEAESRTLLTREDLR